MKEILERILKVYKDAGIRKDEMLLLGVIHARIGDLNRDTEDGLEDLIKEGFLESKDNKRFLTEKGHNYIYS